MTRLEKLRQTMKDSGINGFLVTEPHNRRYLSGFTGSAGILIISQDRQALATDSRYYQQVRQQCPDWELIEVGYSFPDNMLRILLERELGGYRVGFESNHITVNTLHAWERALKGRLILSHTQNFVEELRMQKDASELAHLKKAIALGDETLVHITNWIQVGMTELEVAWELESYMRTHGAEAVSFEPTIASGPNAGKPHAKPTNRVIQAGEPIIMDFGCVIGAYTSDLTRTVCLGQPADDRYLKIWNTVLEAQEAAIAGAKAGLTGEAIDALARDIINETGHKEHFGHSLGHGIGLAVHELPQFSFRYPHEIPAGVIMTIEPGIYIPNWGGVRLEDVVLVNEDGVEVLTTAPKEAVLAR